MRKTKSQEELSKSNDSSINDLSSNTTGFAEMSTYGATSSSGRTSMASDVQITPPNSPKISRTDTQLQVLQLNEETNTWKNLKRKRKSSVQYRNRSSLGSCFGKFESYLKREKSSEFRFRIVVAFIFLSIVLLSMLVHYFYYNKKVATAIKYQVVVQYKGKKQATFIDSEGNNLLKLYFALHIPNDIEPVDCRHISNSEICLDWEYRAHLSANFSRITYVNSFKKREKVSCFHFKWKSYEKYTHLKDCFDMRDSHWFGMGDLYNLRWPLNKMHVESAPFVTSHTSSSNISGSIISRTWFLSKGISITVPSEVPLFVSINSTQNKNQLCLISDNSLPYYYNKDNHYFAHLEYTVCVAPSLSTLQNYLFEKSTNISNKSIETTPATVEPTKGVQQEFDNILLGRIIWSTNVNVLPNLTQQTVQSYVDQITNYGLAGIILLDSRWENSIGQLKMNETVFNNPKVLVNILHNKGFKIMLTISPNIDLRSEFVENASSYLFLDAKLRTPLLTRCSTNHNNICALINFTNYDNCEYFKKIVSKELLTGLSIDGVYLQGIESSLIPWHFNFEKSINPDHFLEQTNLALKNLPTLLGISTSVSSKDFLGYVTIYPRDSTWQSLQTIIPSVLYLGLLGYPLVNTNTVGGNNLFTKIKNETEYINKELYLRWLQLAIFLPVVQFAEPPGGNDLDVIKVAKKLLKLRSEHFVPAMKASLEEFYQKGSPIIRPMWWGQADVDAFLIEDQFFVGNDIIVAPIVEEGKTERDVYLPHGWWKDEIFAQVIRGGKWMRKYQVPLDKLAFFVRTEPSNAPSD